MNSTWYVSQSNNYKRVEHIDDREIRTQRLRNRRLLSVITEPATFATVSKVRVDWPTSVD